jgi:choline kinase
MKAKLSVILLAAGIGRRLESTGQKPKVMLELGGQTLIARHLARLAEIGADALTIVTGFMADDLEAAVIALRPQMPVRFVRNPRFREGSVVSMAAAAQAFREGATVLLMDGDVLYDGRMLPRLLAAEGENVMLLDRDIEPGDEPVKICFDAAGRIVDFRKRPEHAYVRHGESVGFFRFSPTMAAQLANLAEDYAADGGSDAEYEEVIRDHLLAEPERFRAEDVSDLPWTEIDFPEDVVRARDEILPRLKAA